MASTITTKESSLEAIAAVRKQLAAKGRRSLTSFIEKVREADVTGEGQLDEEELDIAMRACGVFLGKRDLSALAKSIDTDGSGLVSRQELVAAVRGDLLGRRLAIVDKSFGALCEAAVSSAAGGGGGGMAPSVTPVTYGDVVAAMRVDRHPDVAAGIADGAAMKAEVSQALGRALVATARGLGGAAFPAAPMTIEAFRLGMAEVSACEPIEEEFVAGMEAVWGATEAEVDEGVEKYLGIIREQADGKRAAGENSRQFLRRQLQRFDLDENGGLCFDEFRRAGELIGLPLSLSEAQRLFDAMPKMKAKGTFDDVPRAGIDDVVMFVFGTDPQPTRG